MAMTVHDYRQRHAMTSRWRPHYASPTGCRRLLTLTGEKKAGLPRQVNRSFVEGRK